MRTTLMESSRPARRRFGCFKSAWRHHKFKHSVHERWQAGGHAWPPTVTRGARLCNPSKVPSSANVVFTSNECSVNARTPEFGALLEFPMAGATARGQEDRPGSAFPPLLCEAGFFHARVGELKMDVCRRH